MPNAILRRQKIGGHAVLGRMFMTGGPFSVAPAGVASTLAIGAPTFSFSSTFSVAPAGMASTLAIGVPTFTFSGPFAVNVPGVASMMSIGLPSVSFAIADSGEPVTLAEAKLAARVYEDDLDLLIQGVISAARAQAEQITSRVYKRRTFSFELAGWPAAGERLQVYDPDVCTISYFDANGFWVSLDASAFEFAASGTGAQIAPAIGTQWPALGARALGPRVRVNFIAGPASRDLVAEQVKLFIKAVVAGWVNFPEAVQPKALVVSPLHTHLLDDQIVYG